MTNSTTQSRRTLLSSLREKWNSRDSVRISKGMRAMAACADCAAEDFARTYESLGAKGKEKAGKKLAHSLVCATNECSLDSGHEGHAAGLVRAFGKMRENGMGGKWASVISEHIDRIIEDSTEGLIFHKNYPALLLACAEVKWGLSNDIAFPERALRDEVLSPWAVRTLLSLGEPGWDILHGEMESGRPSTRHLMDALQAMEKADVLHMAYHLSQDGKKALSALAVGFSAKAVTDEDRLWIISEILKAGNHGPLEEMLLSGGQGTKALLSYLVFIPDGRELINRALDDASDYRELLAAGASLGEGHMFPLLKGWFASGEERLRRYAYRVAAMLENASPALRQAVLECAKHPENSRRERRAAVKALTSIMEMEHLRAVSAAREENLGNIRARRAMEERMGDMPLFGIMSSKTMMKESRLPKFDLARLAEMLAEIGSGKKGPDTPPSAAAA